MERPKTNLERPKTKLAVMRKALRHSVKPAAAAELRPWGQHLWVATLRAAKRPKTIPEHPLPEAECPKAKPEALRARARVGPL